MHKSLFLCCIRMHLGSFSRIKAHFYVKTKDATGVKSRRSEPAWVVNTTTTLSLALESMYHI